MMTQSTPPDRPRRFSFRKPLIGIFRDVEIRVADLSSRGIKVAHREILVPGDEASIELCVPGTNKSVSLRARVVWSRPGPNGQRRSGLEITETRPDRAADLLDHMVRLRWAGDRPNPLRRSSKTTNPKDELLKSKVALDFLEKNKNVAERWRRLVQTNEAGTHRKPIEVLAAWELLGRSIDIDIVARAYRERELIILTAADLLTD